MRVRARPTDVKDSFPNPNYNPRVGVAGKDHHASTILFMIISRRIWLLRRYLSVVKLLILTCWIDWKDLWERGRTGWGRKWRRKRSSLGEKEAGRSDALLDRFGCFARREGSTGEQNKSNRRCRTENGSSCYQRRASEHVQNGEQATKFEQQLGRRV